MALDLSPAELRDHLYRVLVRVEDSSSRVVLIFMAPWGFEGNVTFSLEGPHELADWEEGFLPLGRRGKKVGADVRLTHELPFDAAQHAGRYTLQTVFWATSTGPRVLEKAVEFVI